MNYDNYLAKCVEDYINEETEEEYEEKQEAKAKAYYDRWEEKE